MKVFLMRDEDVVIDTNITILYLTPTPKWDIEVRY